MSLGLQAGAEVPEAIVPPARVQVGFWRVALAVFAGMWLFAVSASILYAILRATGDIR